MKLFNAVRAAQIKGEEASRQVKQKGVVGMGAREEKGRLPNLLPHKLDQVDMIITSSHGNVQARLSEPDPGRRQGEIEPTCTHGVVNRNLDSLHARY